MANGTLQLALRFALTCGPHPLSPNSRRPLWLATAAMGLSFVAWALPGG